MINKIQTKLYFFSLSIFIVLIDQFTKYLIFYNHKKFLNSESFCFTYGDGVADVNIKELINKHKKSLRS